METMDMVVIMVSKEVMTMDISPQPQACSICSSNYIKDSTNINSEIILYHQDHSSSDSHVIRGGGEPIHTEELLSSVSSYKLLLGT